MDLKTFLQQEEIDFECISKEMPEIIRFETEKNDKNGYQDIQEVFRRSVIQAEKMEPLTHQKEIAFYMETLVQSTPLISKEMFDHYKNLELQYKNILHRVLPLLDEFQPEYKKIILETIRIACKERMILVEKYSVYVKQGEER